MAQGLYLSQKMSLQQVLAPQLQQSLALLHAPTLELQALIQQELNNNVTLEEVPLEDVAQEEKQERTEEAVSLDPTEPPADVTFDPATEKANGEPVDEFAAELEKLMQLDQEWRDHYSQANLPVRHSPEDEEKRQFLFDSLTTGTSLQEDLLEQLRTSDLPPDTHQVAEMIIGNIDEHGYLQTTVEDLAASTAIPAEKILAVLKSVQEFDPPGVGARDLRECLMLQLERAGRRDTLEYRVIDECMEELQKRRFPEIARHFSIYVDEVQDAAENIAKLNPKPGRVFTPDDQQYVVAEVFIQQQDGEYVVSTNKEHIPHLRISNTYKDVMTSGGYDNTTREYIRDKIRAAKFLIKSIHQRQQTILNIAREIVVRQREFLELGPEHLKPMTMLQIAEVVGVHETTVSRAVSGKYMQTPQGIFEMKYFFKSGVTTSTGQAISNTSVKEFIQEMFKNENPANPISDQEVVKRLKERGIEIARRTVAKYRSELNILPSNLRKVY
ncbi:MAG: RNA polymerase factor sigma-54 [Verrucomicrobia bacterium]|nr:RNA polymerase factor sigma-54 [Verrucomicrobiota bacterium]